MANVKTMQYSFIWKIETFPLCYYKNGEKLVSPEFVPEIFNGSKWTIELYPKGVDENSLDYISCYLCKKENDENNETITIDYRLEMSGTDGKMFESATCKDTSFTAGYTYGWPEYLKITELDDKMKNSLDDTLIISCHLFSNSKRFECVSFTKFKELRQSFLWNIKMPDEAPEIRLVPFPGNLQFEISVTASDDDIKIFIDMKRNKSSINRILVSKMALLDLRGNEMNSQCAMHLFESENDRFEYPIFITKKQLTENKSSYIEDGCFPLWCEFSVSDGIEYSKIQNSKIDDAFRATRTIHTLQEDFLNMFSNKKHADVGLKVGDEVIPAHKSVLSARSVVFDAMFNQDMIESKTGVVEILDVDAKTMASFLEYVYTGGEKVG